MVPQSGSERGSPERTGEAVGGGDSDGGSGIDTGTAVVSPLELLPKRDEASGPAEGADPSGEAPPIEVEVSKNQI